ncbi:MAG: AMP-binding protein, partial [Actinocatenispora sp.]
MQSSTTLSALFRSVAVARADAVAVTDDARCLTYRELDTAAGAVAAHLRGECGVRPGDMVALLLPPSADMLAAILGILRCGAAYVPLDAQSPPARHALILTDAAPRAVVGECELPAGGAVVTAARLA